MKASPYYQAQEFAQLAGVTVRTLHHYDRLGLLKPSRLSPAGYRLYARRDLGRLEQIVVLKTLGLPLKQIGELLVVRGGRLAQVLRAQRLSLVERRRQFDRAIELIEQAECEIAMGNEPDWLRFKNIIEVIEMQNNTDWMMRYYDDASKEKIAERAKTFTPEMQDRVSGEWSMLLADIAEAQGEDPASEKAQALAARWTKLVEGFTGGDPGVTEGLKKLYSDKSNWPGAVQSPVQSEAWNFISRAMQAGKKKG